MRTARTSERARDEKPPYRVPTMEEIRALPWNGLKVASTFSGGGGSSCGYKMAGFRVIWASEFVEAARETYSANFPDTIVDARDIRKVTPEDVLEGCGLARGELDVLDGSPPCASFSMAGSREKGWGTVKAYSDTEQRSDDLFLEYARLVKGVQPKVFVAENVSGLLRGAAKGYFKEFYRTLAACGYRVGVKLLDAQWLGVPQARQRVIFVGVREDLGVDPAHPTPFPYRYTVRDAIGAARVVHDTSGAWGCGDVTNRPSPSITVGVNAINSNHFKVHGEESIERFAIGKEWKKLKPGQQSAKYFNLVRADENKPSPSVTQTVGNVGAAGVTHPSEPRKFTIDELKAICSFPPDFILKGTYQQQWERCGRAVPPLMMRAVARTLVEEVFSKVERRACAE